MTFTLFQSIWSIVVLITFLGIVVWAYSGKRKSAFDEAAQLPFEDDPVTNKKTSSE
jgi:cytochrome c oxidase cbb3-type subunit 4